MNIMIDDAFQVSVTYQGLAPKVGSFVVSDKMIEVEPGNIEGGYIDEGYMNGEFPVEGSTVKDPILSSWPFVIGVSAGVLVISVVLGILLAKRKIKKGFELYED